MAVEDLTGYAEVDPNSDLTVTSTKSDISSMASNIDVYVRDDKGVNHFGDFVHLVTSEYTSVSGDWALNGFWGLVSDSGTVSLMDMDTANDGLLAYQITPDSSVCRIVIEDYTNTNFDLWAGASFATPYYMTIERSGTTLTCEIYSDSGRTTLEDTLSITCGTDLYRYIFATLGNGNAEAPRYYTGYVENLDLQEVAGRITKLAGEHRGFVGSGGGMVG